jgi:hypothetical protein
MRHELRRAIASISWLLSQSYGMAALTTVIVVLADRSDAFVTSAIVETIVMAALTAVALALVAFTPPRWRVWAFPRVFSAATVYVALGTIACAGWVSEAHKHGDGTPTTSGLVVALCVTVGWQLVSLAIAQRAKAAQHTQTTPTFADGPEVVVSAGVLCEQPAVVQLMADSLMLPSRTVLDLGRAIAAVLVLGRGRRWNQRLPVESLAGLLDLSEDEAMLWTSLICRRVWKRRWLVARSRESAVVWLRLSDAVPRVSIVALVQHVPERDVRTSTGAVVSRHYEVVSIGSGAADARRLLKGR